VTTEQETMAMIYFY